jgi:hypothetical protein
MSSLHLSALHPAYPAIPAGHVEITDGDVRTLDLVWDITAERWAHPTPTDFKMRGRDVRRYFRVARRQH